MFPSTAAHTSNCLPPLATMFAALVSGVVCLHGELVRVRGAVCVGLVFSLWSVKSWGRNEKVGSPEKKRVGIT